MARTLEFTPELLAEHANSMRELAQHLLKDAGEAEDVVQDTWMQVVQRPAGLQIRHTAKSWLHGMVANLARNRRRTKQRRARREEQCARPESGAQLAQASEARGQVMRSVTEALLSLEEPYRSTLLGRFYENLPPRELARLHGVPLATVKSRLQRGLAMLRVRLEGQLESPTQSWGAALGMAFGLPFGALPTPGPTSPSSPRGPALATAGAGLGASLFPIGVLMLKLKVLGVGAAALLGGVYWVQSSKASGPIPRPLDSSLAKSETGAGDDLLLPQLDQEPESTRSAAGEAPALRAKEPGLLATAAEPYVYRISGEALDAEDRPLANLGLLLGPKGHALNQVGSTDAMGRFDLSWTGSQPSMELVIGVSNVEQRGAQLQSLQLQAGHAKGLRITAQATQFFAAMVFTGSDVEGASDSSLGFNLTATSRLLTSSTELPQAIELSSGHLRFSDLPLQPLSKACPRDAPLDRSHYEQLNLSYRQLESSLIRLSVLDAVENVAREQRNASAPSAKLQGILRNALGDPLKDVLVTLGDGSRTRTNAAGEYEFPELPAGPVKLAAGGGRHGWAEAELELKAGETLLFDAYLDRGAELRVQLLDQNDRPLAETDLLLSTRHPEGRAAPKEKRARTDAQGFVAIPNCPEELLCLYVFPSPKQASLPYFVSQNLTAQRFSEGPQELGTYSQLRLPAQPTSSLSFALEDHLGAAFSADFYARLTQLDTGHVIEAPLSASASVSSLEGPQVGQVLPADERRVRFESLPPGAYALEILGGVQGDLNFGTLVLGAGEPRDLGVLRMFPTAKLVLQLSEEAQRKALAGLGLNLLRIEDAISTNLGSLSPQHGDWFQLAAGRQRLEAQLGSQASSLDFELDPGEVRSLEWATDAEGLRVRLGAAPGLRAAVPLNDAEQASCANCHAR